jgi:hypothetical protein
MIALHVIDIACLFSFRCLFHILIMSILFSQSYMQLLPQQNYMLRVEQWCSYFFVTTNYGRIPLLEIYLMELDTWYRLS